MRKHRSLMLASTLFLATLMVRAQQNEASSEPDLDAKYVKMVVPEKLLTDQVFKASITMRNTGGKAWKEGAFGTRLLAIDEEGSTTWGTSYIILGQGRNITPGQENTYSSWLRAPSKPGRYVFQWRSAKMRGSDLFGESTEARTIVVEQAAPEPAPAPPVQPEVGKHVLTFDDFEYAGSFLAPRKGAEGDPLFASSGLALRKMADGTKRLFMIYNRGGLFEAEVPSLLRLDGTNHKDLKIAEVKRKWGNLSAGDVSLNREYCWDEENQTLYWSTFDAYWTGGSKRPVLGASKLEDDGTITPLGPWRVAREPFKAYWGGVTLLPKGFADRYTEGRRMALGFGGYYSICAPTSWGPALGAIARPDPSKEFVDILPLLDYPFAKKIFAPRDGDYFSANCSWGWIPPKTREVGSWTMTDHVSSGVFIDLPDGHGFIVFASLGTGRLGYDYGKIRSAGRKEWWYCYDPTELGRAAKGEKKSSDILPFARTRVEYPAIPGRRGLTSGSVSGSCFDEEDRLLYLFVRQGGRMPCIHAYRVKPVRE
jgi:hypothetical protein